jgi:outer membrane protein OmpA-like peptidoglycan-associated protein
MRFVLKHIAFLLFLCSAVTAQNLVPNCSFEDAWTCPYSFNTIAVAKPIPQWLNPNKGTPDHLHICSTGDASVPENFAGSIYPNEGVAYAGIILRETFDDSTKVYDGVSREYLQTKLIKPLEKNKMYCIKLFYANSSKSKFSVDALGITLTANRIGTKDAGLIIQRPQVINKPGNIMDNIDYWQEMCGIYRAKGNELYLTIGNFWDNYKTSYKINNYTSTDSSFFYAYYYIDDVRVFEIDNNFECGCLNDLSYGSDWLADNFDPETGYNSLDISNLNHGGKLANSEDFNTNNTDSLNKNHAITGHGNENGNGNNENNTNSNLNDIGDANNANIDENSNLLGMRKSEISQEAFSNAGVGSRFNLNRIFFEFNSAELLTASYSELDRLFEILNSQPSLRIEIRGHTDDIGSAQYNKTLSVKRAGAVYDYLIVKGIDKTRMKYRGFGNKVPVADNSTDEGRSQNRRVEIIIVSL